MKTRDGTLYYVLNEQRIPANTDVVPTIYRSNDNGVTWRRAGDLPSGSTLMSPGDVFTEGSDGRLYLAAYTNCWSGTIYQSSNQGRRWEIISGSVPGLSVIGGAQYLMFGIEEVNGKIIHGGGLGGVVFITP